jgi:hypothetical protein
MSDRDDRLLDALERWYEARKRGGPVDVDQFVADAIEGMGQRPSRHSRPAVACRKCGKARRRAGAWSAGPACRAIR